MKWNKKGLIYKPSGEYGWMNTHAQGPTAIEFDSFVRVYFASRPQLNLTMPTFLDLEKNNLNNILLINQSPILDLGLPGSFDEHGIIPKSIIKDNDGNYLLYYIGWSRRANTPYSLCIGLAMSRDGVDFKKYTNGPIIGIEKNDDLSLTAPIVIKENEIYHMFYTSGIGWFYLNNRWEHTYTIRRAWSNDGIDWKRNFKNIIEPKNKFECISNPTILKKDDGFHMWFSYKGTVDFRNDTKESYRIGYAYSSDLINWKREDEKSGIQVSKKGWDSEMIEYPNLCLVNDRVILFYNGNGFGASGFGYAELDF
jgi:hypothetical protein